MRAKIGTLLAGLMLLVALAPASVHAGACTLEAPPITVSDGAVDGKWGGLLTFNITCPAGQTWTLYENKGANFPYWRWTNGADTLYMHICRTSAAAGASCATFPLSTGTVIASGTGTGAVQTATLQVGNGITNLRSTTVGANKIYLAGDFGTSPTPPVNTVVKLTSDAVDYYAPTYSAALISEQECVIASKTNMSLNFSGAARVDGSFDVVHACGYGAAAPPVTVSVGPGNNPSGEVRRAAYNGGHLGYRLYWDTTRLDEIGVNTNNSVSMTPAVASNTRTIYGSVLKDDPGAHNPNGNGAYTDVVAVTISY